MSAFRWNPRRSKAAMRLALGETQASVAAKIGVDERTVRRWLADAAFAAEVDRLSLMSDIAGRAKRVRIAKRVARQRVREDGFVESNKDILDWLKFAQSETNGIQLDLTALAETVEPDHVEQ